MSAEDPSKLVFNGGSLSLSPTDVTTGTSPWGGTALGICKNIVVKVGRRVVTFAEEAFGPMPVSGIDCGEAWSIVGGFRTYDVDVVNTFFASTALGASTGLRGIQYPNGNAYRTGGLISSLGVKLLITPDDVENNRFFYAYNAVPLTDEDAGLPFQRDEEWIVPFRLICLPDGSNRTVAYHLRQDLQSIL